MAKKHSSISNDLPPEPSNQPSQPEPVSAPPIPHIALDVNLMGVGNLDNVLLSSSSAANTQVLQQ
jgi:hypothetical protein